MRSAWVSRFGPYQGRAQAGKLIFDEHQDAELLTVTYSGGFPAGAVPEDLELALWSVFDGALAGNTEGGVAGQLASESVAGIGSVRYVTSGGPEFIQPAATALLGPYRRLSA